MILTSLVIDSLFLVSPIPELEILDRNARLDMLDYWEAHMEARGTNSFDGHCIMQERTDSTILVQLTDVSLLHINIEKDNLIKTTYKINVPSQETETRICYYDIYWNLIKDKKK